MKNCSFLNNEANFGGFFIIFLKIIGAIYFIMNEYETSNVITSENEIIFMKNKANLGGALFLASNSS